MASKIVRPDTASAQHSNRRTSTPTITTAPPTVTGSSIKMPTVWRTSRAINRDTTAAATIAVN